MPWTDWLDDYLRLTEHSEPQLSYRLWTGISTIASVLERKVWVQWNSEVYPCFFIVLVGPPAARKGTAMDDGRWFLDQLKTKMAPDSTTFADIVHYMNKSRKVFTGPGDKKYIHNSVTAHSRELTSLLNDEAKREITFLCDVFDCKPYTKGTKTQGYDRIKAPFFNWLAATQQDTLAAGLPKQATTQGLTSRMIFVVERVANKVLDPRIRWRDQKFKDLSDTLLTRLEWLHGMFGEVQVKPGWEDRYFPWYDNLKPETAEQTLQKYMARKQLHIMKLSIILGISRTGDPVIDAPDFDRALRILSQTERRMGEAFNGLAETKDRSWFVSLILEVESIIEVHEEIVFGELFEKLFKRYKESEVAMAINNLSTGGKIKLDGVTRRNGHLVLSKSKTILKWKEKEK